MDGPGHNPGGWRAAQSATTCPFCGSTVPPAVDRCPQCGRPPVEDGLTVLSDTPLPTPLPTGSADEVTQFVVPSANVKGFVGPEESADDVTRIVAPGDSSEDVTRFAAAPDASEDLTRVGAAEDALTIAASDSPADAMTVAAPVTSTASGARRHRRTNNAGPLEVGQSFGPRYHIIRLLGAGGMGAVYQAWDAELGVAVAIKVIRPEVMEDPATAEEVGRRFKRELLLARQVTHKNVVRIHDIGDIDGIKYITMSYVEGTDLASILKKDGKRPIPELLGIARAVIGGLVAAHGAGVVHRDLKPANIMISKDGEALIMDFGIAHSTGDTGTAPKPGVGVVPEHLTRAATHHAATTLGSIVGTVEYMAPEQARGQAIDQRVDVYAFGLILYDALLGQRRASSGAAAVEELQRRMAAPPPPLQALSPDIPGPLAAFVARCVEPDAEKRFQTSAEAAAALERLDENGHLIAIKRVVRLPYAIAAAILLIAASVGVWWYQRQFIPPPVHDPVSIILADFQNNTGDPSLDRTLEPVMKAALEGASFVTVFDRAGMRRNLGIVPPEVLDEQGAQKIAAEHSVDVVLSATITRANRGYRIASKAVRRLTGDVIAAAEDTANDKNSILGITNELAIRIRETLGDDTSDDAQRFAMATLTASSLDVVHDYAMGMQALSFTKNDEARQYFEKAVASDMNFGPGYVGLAVVAMAADRQSEAEQHLVQAMKHIARMTDREKFQTRGLFHAVTGNYRACTEEYSNLIARFANDPSAHNNLAICYTQLREMPKAIAEMREVVKVLPKRSLYRVNLALRAAYGGEFQTAEEETREAQTLKSRWAPLLRAFVHLGRGQVSPAADAYRELATVDDSGRSQSTSGLGDLAVYQGRFADAVRIFEEGASRDLQEKHAERAADKLIALAHAELARGRTRPAATSADRALMNNSRTVKTRFMAARVFIEAGEIARAKQLASELAKERLAEPRAYAKILEGEMFLKAGDPGRAIASLTVANSADLLDTWIGHFVLGRAYLAAAENEQKSGDAAEAAGLFAQADSEFDRCLKRRGEALSLFLDQEPTFGLFPPVHYYLGRTREGLGATGFAESYKAYLAIRGESTEDSLARDARRRLGL